ncbi:MAG: response regulator, partial [Deltaproteobacteria bacterium]|nr:response regulator [Deltaproteobacteria bacterium]
MTSRQLLSGALHNAGYDVITVKNGLEARDILLSERPPDIALLDWTMPGMTGPELCKVIEQEVDSFIYTVLVTSKTDLESIIFGLESGAHEFLPKPINIAEFNTRMAAAVRILDYEKKLSRKNVEISQYAKKMKELANTRAKQLIHSERLATLGMLSAGIGHEIKNPVAYLSGNVQIAGRYKNDIVNALKFSIENNNGDIKRQQFLLDNGEDLINGIDEGIKKIVSILSGLSKFASKGTREKHDTYLEQSIKDSLDLSRNKWKYHVEAITDIDPNLPPVKAVSQEIIQVLVNLFINASDAMQNRKDNSQNIINISLKQHGKLQRIVVADNGPGIPDDIREKIWDPFFSTKKDAESTGLGLAISIGIIEDHGGTLVEKKIPEQGACFVIDLPVED